jgi:hypothetical protein
MGTRALLIEIRTEPSRREGSDRNERRRSILDVFDRGVRRRAGSAAATATGEFQSVVLGADLWQTERRSSDWNVGHAAPDGSDSVQLDEENPRPTERWSSDWNVGDAPVPVE